MFSKGEYNPKYVANFQRDIQPIIDRISNYQWVANIQSMSGFFSSHVDYTDNGPHSATKRQTYYDYFRGQDNKLKPAGGPQEVLFSTSCGGQLPMMPLNSGSNSVSNVTIEKFLALDATQMFLLVRVNLMIFLCTIEYIKFSDSEVNKARIINKNY
ncbi:MAG: L-lysine 6-oxidase [Paraglaciecola sp.]|jgi:L-lysine 6-oxidase